MVQAEDSLNEVLLKISEGRLGLACIGSKDAVEGIITDGDIRRAMGEAGNADALTAKDMATKNPIFIDESTGLHEMNILFKKRRLFLYWSAHQMNLKGVVQFYDIHNG